VAPVTVSVVGEPAVVEGGVVLATVVTRAMRDVVLQGGEVRLTAALAYTYVTGGIFGATYSSVARHRIDAAVMALPGPTMLRAGREVEHQVLLGVPAEGLPTTDCELVTIEWSVQARVRFEGSGWVDSAPVAIRVLSEGLAGRLALPRTEGPVYLDGVEPRRVRSGTVVTGEVVVGGRYVNGVRGVRVELVVDQVVPYGPMLGDDPSHSPYVAEKEAESVEARVRLLGSGTDLLVPAVGGGDLRRPFRIQVPEVRAPTLVTANFSVRWLVRAVVDRRVLGLPRSLRADLEVVGSTVPSGET
jgi:hypothetical protein